MKEIKALRKARGITQTTLAHSIGVSSAYLSLIEAGKRACPDGLKPALAACLNVPQTLFDAVPTPSGARPRVAQMQSALKKSPQLVAELVAAQAALEAARRALSEANPMHDPELGASDALYNSLSAASAIRSTVSILNQPEDLPEDWAMRFRANLTADSQRLSENLMVLAKVLEDAETPTAQPKLQGLLDAYLEATPPSAEVPASGMIEAAFLETLTQADAVHRAQDGAQAEPCPTHIQLLAEARDQRAIRLLVRDAEGAVLALHEPRHAIVSLADMRCTIARQALLSTPVSSEATVILEIAGLASGSRNGAWECTTCRFDLLTDRGSGVAFPVTLQCLRPSNDAPTLSVGMACAVCDLADCDLRGWHSSL